MHFPPHHLAALSHVLRLGSFDAAAAALLVTPSAISQRIKALEDQVGGTLVRRGPPCTGTQTGRRIAKHAEDIGLLEAQLTRELALDRDPTNTRLKVAVNADSLATWFVEAMASVDGILFDLVIDDQDHSAEWLKRGEVSAAVTAHGKPVTGCDAHALGVFHYVACASPIYMQRWFRDGVTAAAAAASRPAASRPTRATTTRPRAASRTAATTRASTRGTNTSASSSRAAGSSRRRARRLAMLAWPMRSCASRTSCPSTAATASSEQSRWP